MALFLEGGFGVSIFGFKRYPVDFSRYIDQHFLDRFGSDGVGNNVAEWAGAILILEFIDSYINSINVDLFFDNLGVVNDLNNLDHGGASWRIRVFAVDLLLKIISR